ncbi:hypothetical protein AB1Y20_013320 [Prymnesium parvum]|uniref:Uncharacterized protein n=1 Tax=Prymnesium parvum TaxID=97485 RepID=A0AB34IL62_PRYPA
MARRLCVCASLAAVLIAAVLLTSRRRRAKNVAKLPPATSTYRAPALLDTAKYAPEPWLLGVGTRPPREDFATMVDRAAALPEAEGLSCHARDGYDLAGDVAFVWGLNFHVHSAAECCRACVAHRRECARPGSRGAVFWQAARMPSRGARRCSAEGCGCNAWTFCPGSRIRGALDRCFSFSSRNHTRGECWLKHEHNKSMPVAMGPTLPEPMRRAPRRDLPLAIEESVWPWSIPKRISWQAGLVDARDAKVWQGTTVPDWQVRFCQSKHGPC